MKRSFLVFLFGLVAAITSSWAQFVPNTVLTAEALNAALAAPTITGGTITGAPINNAAIGATTPSTGAFSGVTVGAGGVFGTPGASPSGNPGNLTVSGGVPVSGRGGSLTLAGVDAVGSSNNGGAVTITSGAGGSSGSAGSILIQAGNRPSSGGGGNITVKAASVVTGSAAGAFVSISGGDTVTATANAGAVTIAGGNNTGSGGGGSAGTAGAATVTAGTSTDGRGGAVNITATDGAGSDHSGGIVTVTEGSKTGAGTQGYIRFTGRMVASGKAAPTVGASACGTSPTIAGNDNAMQVTVGTGGSATACVVTFSQTWPTNAPVCVVQSDTDIVAYKIATSATVLTATASAAFTASSHLNIICVGRI